MDIKVGSALWVGNSAAHPTLGCRGVGCEILIARTGAQSSAVAAEPLERPSLRLMLLTWRATVFSLIRRRPA